MQITYKIQDYTTNSGKQAISWQCVDCHCQFFDLGAYFYQSTLVKDNIEESLNAFIDAINNKTVAKLFNKQTTAKKLYDSLCDCSPGVIDIEYVKAVKRAKDILARGISQL